MRGRAPTAASDRAVYDVLMRRRAMSGREHLSRVRARVDAARGAEQLRAALMDESALCLKRMERLPKPTDPETP